MIDLTDDDATPKAKKASKPRSAAANEPAAVARNGASNMNKKKSLEKGWLE